MKKLPIIYLSKRRKLSYSFSISMKRTSCAALLFCTCTKTSASYKLLHRRRPERKLSPLASCAALLFCSRTKTSASYKLLHASVRTLADWRHSLECIIFRYFCMENLLFWLIYSGFIIKSQDLFIFVIPPLFLYLRY